MPKNKIFLFFSWILYHFIAHPFLYLYLKVGYNIKIEGRKNFIKFKKTKRGAVSICNHVHYVDCAMVSLALSPKKVIFTTLAQNFQIPVAGFLIKMLGGVPVSEKPNEIKIMYNEVVKELKRKRIVQIYPEAHLINYYEGIREFYNGAFRIACEAQVPILPLAIFWRDARGLHKIFKGKPCPVIKIGNPIEPDYRLMKREMVEDLKERTACEMKLLINNNDNNKTGFDEVIRSDNNGDENLKNS